MIAKHPPGGCTGSAARRPGDGASSGTLASSELDEQHVADDHGELDHGEHGEDHQRQRQGDLDGRLAMVAGTARWVTVRACW